MTLIDIPLDLKQFGANSADAEIINAAESCRTTARRLITEERYMDALERTVELKTAVFLSIRRITSSASTPPLCSFTFATRNSLPYTFA